MASVTMQVCTVPHWQGDTFIALGATFPDGAPEVINPDWFKAEVHELTTTKKKSAE